MIKIFLPLLISILLLIDPVIANDFTSDPENSKNKLEFILKNFEFNKLYKISSSKEIFINLLIGSWSGPPHAAFKFFANKKFEMIDYSLGEQKIIGNWKIEGENICLLGNKKWICSEVKYYKVIKKRKRGKERITMIVMFDKRLFNTSVALDIRFTKSILKE